MPETLTKLATLTFEEPGGEWKGYVFHTPYRRITLSIRVCWRGINADCWGIDVLDPAGDKIEDQTLPEGIDYLTCYEEHVKPRTPGIHKTQMVIETNKGNYHIVAWSYDKEGHPCHDTQRSEKLKPSHPRYFLI